MKEKLVCSFAILTSEAKHGDDQRPWQDSNLQSPDPKSGALSIRPHDLLLNIKQNMNINNLITGGK